MSVDDEQELIKEIQKDSRKFGYLFDLYYKPVFRYIFCRIVLYDVSRDIAAETFLKAFLSVPDTGNIKPHDELKITLLSAKKTAATGVWLIAIPVYFLFCVFMKYYFHYNLHLFDIINSAMVGIFLLYAIL